MPSFRLRLLAVVPLAVLAAPLLLAAPAVGADGAGSADGTGAADAPETVIEVGADGEDRYDPAEVTVEAGEEVTFLWVTGSHSVTHQPEGEQGSAFDTHPDCEPDGGLLDPRHDCGETGEQEQVTLDEPGTYAFACRAHEDMTGVINVEDEQASTDEGRDDEGRDDEGRDGGDGSNGTDEDADEDGDADQDTAASGDGDGDGTGSGSDDGGSDDGPPVTPDVTGEAVDEHDPDREQARDALSDFTDATAGADGPPSLDEPEGGIDVDENLAPEVDDGDQAGEQDEPVTQTMPDLDRGQADLEPFPEPGEVDRDEVALPVDDGPRRTVPIALASLGVIGGGIAVGRQLLGGA